MAASWIPSLARPGIVRALATQARLAWRLIREPGVPRTAKAFLALPAAYLLSPFDLLTDFVPGLGQLDDVAVVLVALRVFVSLCPQAAVAFHRAAIERRRAYAPMPPSDVVIDAKWRRE